MNKLVCFTHEVSVHTEHSEEVIFYTSSKIIH